MQTYPAPTVDSTSPNIISSSQSISLCAVPIHVVIEPNKTDQSLRSSACQSNNRGEEDDDHLTKINQRINNDEVRIS